MTMTLAIAGNEWVERTIGRGPAEYGPGREWPRAAETRYLSPSAESVEHEVRSLLHLVGLLSYCVLNCTATEDERAHWRRETVRANKRLARLRAAGCCPPLLR